MAISDYSSHDWRKNTDDAVVVDKNKAILKVNECFYIKLYVEI